MFIYKHGAKWCLPGKGPVVGVFGVLGKGYKGLLLPVIYISGTGCKANFFGGNNHIVSYVPHF